jgi:tryptophan synthase alpha chain
VGITDRSREADRQNGAPRRSDPDGEAVGRIGGAFAEKPGRAALMPYLMGGFPTIEGSKEVGFAYADGGADLVELGVPFSDPLADGPVIHAAGTEALRAGATLTGVLDVCEEISPRVPVVLMCYSNIVLARGADTFARRAVDAGASGLIVPDLPLEESAPVLEACDAAGLALVPLVAPTSPDDRLAKIGAQARGFLYTVSVTGTTGERTAGGDAWAPVISRAHACTRVPVALGFGIGTPEQAAEAAAAGADGVIIGSRLVRAVAEAPESPGAVRDLVAGFADALRT